MLGSSRLKPRYRGWLALVVGGLILLTGPWLYLHVATAGSVRQTGEPVESAEAALVFGTLVNEDGTLSPRLAERVEVAASLFLDGNVPRLVMSGTSESDTGQDETARMRDYAVSLGVPAAAISLDRLGLDTSATCDRAATVYGLHRVIVVTNEFHIARATWLCQRAGLSAVGIHAPATPAGWTIRGNAREVLAAWKVVLTVSSRGDWHSPATSRLGITPIASHTLRSGSVKASSVQRAKPRALWQDARMGIFTKGDRTADADFAFLSADDARVMRGLAAEAFARSGLRVKSRGDHLVGPKGQLFGLYTLAAECHGISRGPEAWVPAVEKHVRTLLMSAGMETPSA